MPQAHTAQMTLLRIRNFIASVTILHLSHFLTLHSSVFISIIFCISWVSNYSLILSSLEKKDILQGNIFQGELCSHIDLYV